MRLSRIVIKNFRTLEFVDAPVKKSVTCIVGENNTGKSCLIHALRICLDINLPSSYRALIKDDIYAGVDRSKPFQVLIGVEFEDFVGNDNQEAMLHGTQIGNGRARIFYRYRPKRQLREAIAREERDPATLTLEDYSWDLVGGGNPAVDLKDIEWDDENEDIGATKVGLQYLQAFLVVFLPALRDVEADLLQYRKSPLAQLIEACEISAAEQETLVQAVQTANASIEASPTIRSLAEAIDSSFKEVTGPAFSMDVDLGLSAPTFQAIVRNLKVLLSGQILKVFEPKSNGLGLNNILYMAILIEYFRKRAAQGKAAGELLLIEEPEAHLHPQLQLTLFESLTGLPFQSILTTHSAHITAKAALDSFVLITAKSTAAPSVSTLAGNTELSADDVKDLERYLDATKSGLLFARKVMLVEGAAELLLIPQLVKKTMNIDLEREGISLVAIHGTHFGPFARLFSDEGLPKKCAIVADADRGTSDAEEGDDVPAEEDYSELENDYVKAFLGETTFERELTVDANLPMLAATARELGAPRIADALDIAALVGTDETEKDRVLRTAKRFGKGRFAQVATRHIHNGVVLPDYIREAVEWLMAA